jgi:hypothetical protein
MSKKVSNEAENPALNKGAVSSSKPALAYEWHNYKTGHCYVDYIPKTGMDEKNGYTKIQLYHCSIEDRTETICIKFGRWLLKNADPSFDKDALCWMHREYKKFYNTDELYKLFLEQL